MNKIQEIASLSGQGSQKNIKPVYFKYTMTSTTIKLKLSTKVILDGMLQGNETYDDLVRRALRIDERHALEARMREGYSTEREFTRKTNAEWEVVDAPWPE